MKEPNMAAITASLERSLQNCSLNHHHHHQTSGVLGRGGGGGSGGGGGGGDEEERSSSSDEGGHEQQQQQQQQSMPSSDTSLELNSHLSLPYHWEQCLDLKTGEIYYINWRNGMKAKEDPRLATPQEHINSTNGSSDQNLYSEFEDDSSNYDSEESSSEHSPPSSSSRNQNHRSMETSIEQQDHVLVVGGCKSCLMYFMVPKQVFDCPKCSGQLLHFDRSENGSSP